MKNLAPRFATCYGYVFILLALCAFPYSAARAALRFEVATPSYATWSGHLQNGLLVRFDLYKVGHLSEWTMSITGNHVAPYYVTGAFHSPWRVKNVKPASVGGPAPGKPDDYACANRVAYNSAEVYQAALHHAYRPAHAFAYQPTQAIPTAGELLVLTDARNNFMIIDHAPQGRVACVFLTGNGWKTPQAYDFSPVLPMLRSLAGPR